MEATEKRVPMACYLTTTDNPYDPSEDFLNWYTYDETHGYQSSERLAAIARTSDEFSEEENALIIEDAIDFLIAHCTLTFEDGTPLFKKISKPLVIQDDSES